MKRNARQSETFGNIQHRREPYQKALDGRKRAVPGVWIREGRYYGRVYVEDAMTGVKQDRRLRLIDPATGHPAVTVAQAVAAMEKLKVQRRDGRLPMLRQAPLFRDYAQEYLERVRPTKRSTTIAKEAVAIRRWNEQIGGSRLDKITKAQVLRFRDLRIAQDSASPRTVNLDLVALRNVLKRAQDDGLLKELPTAGVRALKVSNPKRQLYSPEQIEHLTSKALEASKNGLQFRDYIRLLCRSGARRDEALRLRWQDVDFEKGTLIIGADGLAKNHDWRVIEMNPSLEAHLREMRTRKAPDSDWLFPSPQRGDKNRALRTFKETLTLARKATGLVDFGFHDCRHYFVSHAVMAGINFMTIAKWSGHKDGGVLIGRVYGHLSDEHAKSQAQRLNFGTTETKR